MKILIAYYSRSGITAEIAKELQKQLNCDIEEIKAGKKYDGKIGYMKGGFDASTNRGCEIEEITKNPKDYDLVIIGTPVWASNMATPVYSYLLKYNKEIKNIAAFCTCISGGYERTLEKISEISNKELKSEMYLTSKDKNNYGDKINSFIKAIT